MTNLFKRLLVAVFAATLVAVSLANSVFASSTENSLNEYVSSGYNLFTAKRFADAEVILRKAVDHKDIRDLSFQSRLKIFGLLESTLMYQNKYAEVYEILNGNFVAMEANGMKPSFEYATSMLNAAESLYYMGQKGKAIEVTQASIAMMKSLPLVSERAITFAEANIEQYRANRVETMPMMKDMSQFFTLCENITNGTTMTEVRKIFSNSLEVGRSYFPKGIMTDVFANAIPVGIDRDKLKNIERTIFIPDAEHSSDWCIVYKENSRVKRTIAAPD